MITVSDIKKCSSIYEIPKSIHCNKDVLLDFRLAQTLGEINSDPERDIKYDFDVYLPKYGINLQRPYVWEHCQQQEFIMSILLDKPLEHIIIVSHNDDVKNRGDRTYFVIDGKQRLMTIQKFMHNEFSVKINGVDAYWRDMDDESQWYFISRVNYMVATVYYSYDNNPVTDDMKIILFNFYNFSGTQQTEEHKNTLQKLLNSK